MADITKIQHMNNSTQYLITTSQVSEPQLNKVNITNWINTSANIHNHETQGEMLVRRFFASDDAENYATSYDLPCVDSHNLIFSIDKGTSWNRVLSLDMRSNDIYARAKTSGTWGNWEKLVRNTGTWSISITGNAATATKATQDADGKDIRDRYFRVYNTGYLGNSDSVTVNDLATQGPAYGMINAATDNPGGAAGWRHVLNMSWGKTNQSWIGQIALDCGGSWLRYRATSGGCAGLAWKTVLDSSNYTSYASAAGHTHDYMPTSWRKENVIAAYKGASMSTTTSGYWAAMVNQGSTGSPTMPTSSGWWHILSMDWSGTDTNNWISQLAIPTQDQGSSGNNTLYFRHNNSGGTSISSSTWYRVWREGLAVTSAVWNDYAEYRESEIIEPGYILCEKGDGSLYKSTKRCQEFAGVSSDTWGFAQGETEKAKTPIAVSGRVLVYVKDKVKVNDYICSGPDGIGLKMHWWEKILYPHRVVGIVSEIPTYEKWGGGENADRDPVDVNGRIWIKCCN